MVEPMGIRYYAYPVAAELAELAAASPHDLIGSDPFFDAWGPVDRRPHMLYLDKAWRNLQAVFGPSDSGGTCPAFELVRGEVTMRDDGWDPFVRYLDADTTREIAADLANVDECYVMSGIEALRRKEVVADFSAEVDYTIQYLNEAISFTRDLASSGQGLVYMIG
jgi:hypothetical protein